jgi:hypothetical protein
MPRDRESCGVVTLADSNYFPGLKLLYDSIKDTWPVGITCFDIGLTAAQKGIIASECAGLEIRPLPQTEHLLKIKQAFGHSKPLAKAIKRVWPLWICPFLIAMTRYNRVFWLDCDIAVLRNLGALFSMLDEGPVFTPENNAPEVTANNPVLYRLLPIERRFNPDEPKVNGGVSGWELPRDRALLDAYMYPIIRACEDQNIANAISWHDQGALIWAIQKLGLEHRVLKTNNWNLCVRNTSIAREPVAWNDRFLETVRKRVTEANLLHWNGTRPPWEENSNGLRRQ